jgi:hypothetical protein
MAKRFTDSRKWEDPWFTDLPIKMKLFWLYLLDKCDHAGMYKVNLKLASFLIGESIDADEIVETFNGRIVRIDGETWHIPKFIVFQYGELKEDSSLHRSVIALLESEGVTRVTAGLGEGATALYDKDKNKRKDKDKETITETSLERRQKPTLNEVTASFSEKGLPDEAPRFFNYYEANGWRVGKNPMRNWKAAVANWISNAPKYSTSKNKLTSQERISQTARQIEKDIAHL